MIPVKNNKILENLICVEQFESGEISIPSYKNFFYNRNGFSLYKSDGTFNIHKTEYGVLRYLRRIMAARKKWSNFQYKKRYLLKKRYGREVFRIKNYVQKTILVPHLANYQLVQNRYIDTIQYVEIDNKNLYSLNLLELLYIKIRFIKNVVKV